MDKVVFKKGIVQTLKSFILHLLFMKTTAVVISLIIKQSK